MGTINELLQQQTPAPIEVSGADALAELVGEGKKYATVEDLAKGNLNAQQHIGTLEHETASLREQSSNAKSIEDVLKAIEGTPPAATLQPAADQQPAKTELSVAEQITAAFSQRDQQSVADTQAQNQATLVQELGKTYGADALNVFNAVGEELGLDLNELAGKSPAAVMKLIASARPAPQQNLSQALPNGQNMPQQQQFQQGGVLNKTAIDAMYASGKIKLAEKHQMENKQLTVLGRAAFYK